MDSEVSGDYDDEYDYDDDDDLDVSSGGGNVGSKKAKNDAKKKPVSDADTLDKVADDADEKQVDADDNDDDDDDDDDDVTTTAPTVKDDIHFVDEDDAEVQIEQETKTKPRRPATNSKKDELLYEYYSEYLDEDYDDLNDNGISDKKKPAVVAITTSRNDDVVVVENVDDNSETEKSAIFPPSYIFLIIASALVSFTVFMLAFLVCRRTVAQRRQKKLMPFIVSSTSMPTNVKSSGPIVKNYQRVPTSTKEFLYQQQQQQQQQVDQGHVETKEPLLT